MNASDLARLELAKRAYRATEPNAAEVQRAVRKARLGLQRPRGRSTWFTKTAVALVLAMGGLAFAKPQALGELVQTALKARPDAAKQSINGGLAVAPAAPTPEPAAAPAHVAVPAVEAPVVSPAVPPPASPAVTHPAPVVAAAKAAPQLAAAKPAAAPVARQAAPVVDERLASGSAVPAAPGSSSGSFGDDDALPPQQRSDWGRVGSALAGGDEPRAMAVLNQLSESEDRRTRDKADLGRAQLMMSNGNRDQACATARSLTKRGAGSRIERQAQVLLKGCQR